MDDTDEASSGFKNREEYEVWKASKIKETQEKRSSQNDNGIYYQILGIKSSASKEEIKQAYKDLLSVWNPERFHDDPQLKEKASAKIKEIDGAYEKLLVQLVTASSTISQGFSGLKESALISAGSTNKLESTDGQYNSSYQETAKEPAISTGEVRPWVRLWARNLDLFLLSLPVGFIVGALFPAFIAYMGIGGFAVIGLLVFPFVFAMEAITIAIFGNTPAKAILRIKVTDTEGNSLSFAEALKRGFYIYFAGYAMGIQLIYLGTFFWQYTKLIRYGKTSWDNRLGTNVTHSHIGGVRIAAFVCVSVICNFAVMAILAVLIPQWAKEVHKAGIMGAQATEQGSATEAPSVSSDYVTPTGVKISNPFAQAANTAPTPGDYVSPDGVTLPNPFAQASRAPASAQAPVQLDVYDPFDKQTQPQAPLKPYVQLNEREYAYRLNRDISDFQAVRDSRGFSVWLHNAHARNGLTMFDWLLDANAHRDATIVIGIYQIYMSQHPERPWLKGE